jgi:hypothetical protein
MPGVEEWTGGLNAFFLHALQERVGVEAYIKG